MIQCRGSCPQGGSYFALVSPAEPSRPSVPLAAESQLSPSAVDRHTINVTYLQTETREILEDAHARVWRYIIPRRIGNLLDDDV
jgi:hypothetical protein